MKTAIYFLVALLVELISAQGSTTSGTGEKPGVCPVVPQLSLGRCNAICQTDSECGDNLKCCKTGCDGLQCKMPDEKPGVCPEISNVTTCENKPPCSSDTNCERDLKCCSNGCGGFSCQLPREIKENTTT
ncbi:waprin-Thr1-like [Rhinophrynus dorsalis]